MKNVERRPLPAEPTRIPPGTPERAKLYLERYDNGEQLYHPADAKYDGDTTPLLWMKWKKARDREATARILDKIKSRKG